MNGNRIAVMIHVNATLAKAKLPFSVQTEQLIATVAVARAGEQFTGWMGSRGVETNVARVRSHFTPNIVGRQGWEVLVDSAGMIVDEPLEGFALELFLKSQKH